MLYTLSGRHARCVAGVVAVAMLALTVGATSTRAQTARAMQFGADFPAVARARTSGFPLTYGTLWIGSWTQRSGWGSATRTLNTAAASNITPVINWWYWGDDISPNCVENGCWDARQGVAKDKATWYRLTSELADLIVATMGSRETVVVLETEFNKNGIESYEPFDGYLAELAALLHARGNIKVVLGFGNWGLTHWPRFDRAIAASDMLGMQLMRSAVRDAATYPSAVSTLLASARYLQTTFGKPTIVTDLALSSYGNYEGVQSQVIGELFARMAELKDAGVQAVLYRMIFDDPTFDTSNYHGVAERHWGLLRGDGSAKPAFAVFAAGVSQESAASQPGPTCAPSAPVNFQAHVQGSIVTLGWSGNPAGGIASAYLVEAGSAPGLANLAVAAVPVARVQVTAPPGTYYVRIRAQNGCGVSGPSTELVIRV